MPTSSRRFSRSSAPEASSNPTITPDVVAPVSGGELPGWATSTAPLSDDPRARRPARTAMSGALLDPRPPGDRLAPGSSGHDRRGREGSSGRHPSRASPPPSRPPPAPGGAVGGLARVAPDLVAGEVPGALADGPAQGEEVHHPPEQAPASHLTLPIGNASTGHSGAEARPCASAGPTAAGGTGRHGGARAGWSGPSGANDGRGSGARVRGASL